MNGRSFIKCAATGLFVPTVALGSVSYESRIRAEYIDPWVKLATTATPFSRYVAGRFIMGLDRNGLTNKMLATSWGGSFDELEYINPIINPLWFGLRIFRLGNFPT